MNRIIYLTPHFAVTGALQPRDFPPEDSLYVWGPPCPADFGENKEAWS